MVLSQNVELEGVFLFGDLEVEGGGDFSEDGVLAF